MPQYYNDPSPSPSGSSQSGDGEQYSDSNPPNFNTDKAGWVRHYYGEEYLEDGKYPKGIPIDFGGPTQGPRGGGTFTISGYKTTPETHPWLYPGPGDVHTNGQVYPEQSNMYDQQGGFFKGFKASPADIKASHDKRNYYKNGGQGVPPEIMRTFVDDRSPNSPYWQRYFANAGKPPEKRPYPNPEEVTGPYGRYQYQRAVFVKDPHTRATDYQVGYRSGGVQPSRFISNGTVWDPDNPLPRGSAPPGRGTGQPPAPPPSHREPPAASPPGQSPVPPPQQTNPPPPEPPSRTGPVKPRPDSTTSMAGSPAGAPAAPGPDPMAMVQGPGSGLLSQVAPPAQPPAQPPVQQGALSQARAQVPPQSGMFGT